MTRNEAIERIGGRKKAAGILGVGCLVPVLLACGLLFGGVGWVGSWFTTYHQPYQESTIGYQSISEAECDSPGVVRPLYRKGEIAGYGCVVDMDGD